MNGNGIQVQADLFCQHRVDGRVCAAPATGYVVKLDSGGVLTFSFCAQHGDQLRGLQEAEHAITVPPPPPLEQVVSADAEEIG